MLYVRYCYSIQGLCGACAIRYRARHIWAHQHSGTIRAIGAQLADPDHGGIIPQTLDQESSTPHDSALARILGSYLRDLLEHGWELALAASGWRLAVRIRLWDSP